MHFAMSDNSYSSTFGPSTPGAINLVSGQTHGAIIIPPSVADDNVVNGTIIADPDPRFDDCSKAPTAAMVQGKNIGDLLNAKDITWGWFQGGFKPTSRIDDGKPFVVPRIRTLLTRTRKITAPTTSLFSITNPQQILIIFLLNLLQ
jgi:Phosphoesterase family